MAQAEDAIREVADEVAEQAQDVGKRVGDRLSDAVAGVSGTVSETADKLKESAQAAAGAGKDYAADALHGLATGARGVAGKLEERRDGDSRSAGYAREAADRIDDLSERLRDLDAADAAKRARSLVRDNPVLVLGAAVVVGFALARLLKGNGDD